MAPVSITAVGAAVAAHTLAECRGLATLALDAEDGRDARNAVRAATRG
jgi:phosphoenolpyruvate-protein phosphotransferase (PTS system enzyme I)